jgi:hypothetical protein
MKIDFLWKQKVEENSAPSRSPSLQNMQNAKTQARNARLVSNILSSFALIMHQLCISPQISFR